MMHSWLVTTNFPFPLLKILENMGGGCYFCITTYWAYTLDALSLWGYSVP